MKSKLYNSLILPTYLTLFHIAFIILMGIFARYKFVHGQAEVPGLYAMFMDVHSMMFVGFGFLMTFLKRYGYGSVGFNFIVAAYVLEWSMLVVGWLESTIHESNGVFDIHLINLLQSDFIAAAILISFGAVIGKATLSQLIAMATIEVVLQVVNEYIGHRYLLGYDIGESIYVHVFGAYFGLAVAGILSIGRETESEKESSNYHSDLFSMIGTLFLWLYWPSFNSATALYEGQTRAIINTYLSITASCICTFITSLYINRGKLNMVHVQNATLAGGVAIGAIADMAVNPFGSMIVGSVAGVVSTLGFQYVTPFLNHKFIHDTCGVNNLHGIPGVISGLASAVVAGFASHEGFYGNRLYIFYPSRIPIANSTEYHERGLFGTEFAEGGIGRTAAAQAGYQLATLALTLGIAIIGGVITGFILRTPLFEQISNQERLFDDEAYWKTPEDFELLLSEEEVNEKKESKKNKKAHHESPVQTMTIKAYSSSNPNVNQYNVADHHNPNHIN